MAQLLQLLSVLPMMRYLTAMGISALAEMNCSIFLVRESAKPKESRVTRWLIMLIFPSFLAYAQKHITHYSFFKFDQIQTLNS
ncbi:hypothetical protein A6F49_06980 [Enteractinococcus helveticum]|uniref:Uncharacterized protein n=1 Tax=Enteractinococcus helveticum TaxID=1837282 RepID=A0A1B7M1J4_9MICC|nr:hypothetical protein A6F49_06980 [Enteractinococcus helveticum]